MSGTTPDRKMTDAEDFAIYVAALAGELSRLARGHGFSTLAYLLEMARLEARACGPTQHMSNLPPQKRRPAGPVNRADAPARRSPPGQ